MWEHAILQAKKSTVNYRMGAIIASRNQIISQGFNKLKSHPLMFHYGGDSRKVFLHAEIHAIVNALRGGTKDFSGMEIYTVRIKKDQSLACSKPCPICLGAIAELGLKAHYINLSGEKIYG